MTHGESEWGDEQRALSKPRFYKNVSALISYQLQQELTPRIVSQLSLGPREQSSTTKKVKQSKKKKKKIPSPQKQSCLKKPHPNKHLKTDLPK